MTHEDLTDIELILIEANAYNLRDEVKELAVELIDKYKSLLEKDAYEIAFKRTTTILNI
jgi:hypothetical protein